MNFQLLQFRSPDELAEAAANEWLKEIETASRRSAPYAVALSGGRIAGRFLAATARLAKSRGVGFGSVHFFWSDERCVPPESAESNFGLARDNLFKPLAIPEDQIHRVRGELPQESAVSHAEAELRRIAPVAGDGQPVLDLVFLGLGEEGHVASLFPGEPEEMRKSRAVFRAVIATKPPPQRITLGYPAIAAARQAWVLASGQGKQGALRESLAPGGRTPLARVLQMRYNTTVFTDIRVSA